MNKVIAAERIKPNGAVCAGMRILTGDQASNAIRIGSLIPEGYEATDRETCRQEVRQLTGLADMAASGRTESYRLSDGSTIKTREL